jgi:DNA-binding NtrC family response regulator
MGPSGQGEKKSLFLTADEKMKRIQDIVWQIADTNVPVLISGESGSGKEVIARSIHDAGQIKDRPMVVVNCASMPAALLESELFGHEKDAFPGATTTQTGKLEQANGGTIILDEITELEPTLQAKILRVLQDKEIERVGGKTKVPVNTRIIASTSKDILGLVQKGQFRQDLYYRLYVIHIEVPSLRDRPKDIPLLAEGFLSKYASDNGKQLSFTSESMAILTDHNWPGNVRELENVIQRAAIMADGNLVERQHLPLTQEEPKQTSAEWVQALPIGETLRTVETQFILETLKSHNGNRTHAARTLGISLRTLRNKINEFTAEGFEVMAPQSGRAS